MPDRENVISTLEEIKTQTAGIGLDSAVIAHKFIDKIISLLKEQEAEISEISDEYLDLGNEIAKMPNVVRCKDCVHWDKHIEECGNPDSVCFHNGWCKPDWFCADRERKEVK